MESAAPRDVARRHEQAPLCAPSHLRSGIACVQADGLFLFMDLKSIFGVIQKNGSALPGGLNGGMGQSLEFSRGEWHGCE